LKQKNAGNSGNSLTFEGGFELTDLPGLYSDSKIFPWFVGQNRSWFSLQFLAWLANVASRHEGSGSPGYHLWGSYPRNIEGYVDESAQEDEKFQSSSGAVGATIARRRLSNNILQKEFTIHHFLRVVGRFDGVSASILYALRDKLQPATLTDLLRVDHDFGRVIRWMWRVNKIEGLK
jgi:hypothetical protein